MTTDQLPLRVDPAQTTTAIAGELVASLPISYRASDAADAAVVLVDGRAPDWVAAAGAVPATAVALVLDPGIADPPAVRALLASGARVALSETWAGNPAVAAARNAWHADLAAAALVEVAVLERTAGADASELVLRALRVALALGIDVASLDVVTGGDRGRVVTGQLGSGGFVTLVVTRSDAAPPSVRVDVAAPDAGITLELADGATARPARARRVSRTDALELPTVWQTAHRSSLQRIHALGAGAAIDDLAGFAAALELLPPG
jgi:hypothetical protein